MAAAVAYRATALVYVSIVGLIVGAILFRSALAGIRGNRRLVQGLSNVLQFRADSDQDFLDLALDEAVGLTCSRIGYLYFHQPDGQELVLRGSSSDVRPEASGEVPASRFDLAMSTGLLNDVVRTRRPITVNDFRAVYPSTRGDPPERAALHRVLAVPVFSGDRIVAVVAVANKSRAYDDSDIERLQVLLDSVWAGVEGRTAAKALADSDERFRRLVLDAPFPVMLHADDGAILQVSRSWCDITGYAREELTTTSDWTSRAYGDRQAQAQSAINQLYGITQRVAGGQFAVRTRTGDVRTWDFCSAPLGTMPDGRRVVVSMAVDITDRERGEVARRKAEKEQARLGAHLQQMQKIDAIGRLAGGIAHDFNNLLGVILGHADLALGELHPAQPHHADLLEIRKAALRSAELTSQLLAVARKQTSHPRVVNLNEAVSLTLHVLQRVLGEGIDLRWKPAPDLWPVRVDPVQLDQVLSNLCVNAREAIAGVGNVTIETGHFTFTPQFCAMHPGSAPGEKVVLTVSDTGRGMEKGTLTRVYEPFFTAKGAGKGTGLGLATVYGIVKQNGGYIDARSEVGSGTCFQIYLPRHVGKTEHTMSLGAARASRASSGHETILLAEDEDGIRNLAARMLTQHGYHVLSADTPGAAIQLANEHGSEIHLLLTDVVMPGMNGKDLGLALRSRWPRLKCLFMSGYTADVIARHGVLDDGISFIQKPFTAEQLAASVRDVLDHEPALES